MDAPLMRAGVTVPPLPPRMLERSRLADLLDEAARNHRLTMIAAPAGYGKTVLAAEWARRTRVPVGWLSVDAADQDPERFLRHLFASWALAQPDIEQATPGVLLSGVAPNLDGVLAELVRFASENDSELALVIDDCHVIENTGSFQALAYLVDQLPRPVHVILTGRTEPPLPLARYRARQELAEIGVEELQFTAEESASLLCDVLGLSLSRDDIEPLHARLEGWAAGLLLVSLTLRGNRRVPPALITGRHRFIADYLRDDVLVHLPTETRAFLLRTSILTRLTGSLCDAVTGSVDGQETLERLEREHLFTRSLDDNREWYRYHPLFADVLRHELERRAPDDIADLHRRAASWHLRHDLSDPAFDHALAAADLPLVKEVLERYGQVKLFTGQLRALHDWLTALPDAWYDQEPEIGLLRVAWLMFTGQFGPAIHTLDTIERTVSDPMHMNQRAMGRVSAIRCFIACESNVIDQAERFADIALDTLPPTDDEFRGGVWGALGDVYRRNGRWRDAQDHYLRSLRHANTPAGYVQSVHAFGALADLELRQGHLRAADAYWRNARDVISDERLWGAYPLPVIGWVHIRRGEILYEWNDLDAASDALARGRASAALGGDPRSIIAGGLLAARLHLAHDEIDAAADTIEHTRPIVTEARFPEWSSEFERCQVALWLAQGKVRTAVTWANESMARDPAGLHDQEPASLAVARVLIVKGDTASIDHALTLLQPLLRTADGSGRIGLQVATLALQAMARWHQGDRADALISLEHALRLAEPEGYARTFVDLGLPMARMLQEARARGVMRDTTSMLLNAFGAGAPRGTSLPEPLSERERDVLRHLAAGLTNREIAEALYISPETVKKHTGSIYGKLVVRGRTEAVTRARSLDLLD